MTNSVSLEGLFRNASVATSFLIQVKNRISTLTNSRDRLAFVKFVSLFWIAQAIHRETSLSNQDLCLFCRVRREVSVVPVVVAFK